MTAGGPLRALIIEHDPADAHLILSHLERAGFTVSADVATTRDELSAKLAAGRYDAPVRKVREVVDGR